MTGWQEISFIFLTGHIVLKINTGLWAVAKLVLTNGYYSRRGKWVLGIKVISYNGKEETNKDVRELDKRGKRTRMFGN